MSVILWKIIRAIHKDFERRRISGGAWKAVRSLSAQISIIGLKRVLKS